MDAAGSSLEQALHWREWATLSATTARTFQDRHRGSTSGSGSRGCIVIPAGSGGGVENRTEGDPLGSGSTWHTLAPCPAQTSLVSVSAASTRDVAVACAGGGAMGSQRKTVLVSHDGGGHLAATSAPPDAGDLAGVTSPAPGSLVVAAVSGASWLYGTFDDGRSPAVSRLTGTGRSFGAPRCARSRPRT